MNYVEFISAVGTNRNNSQRPGQAVMNAYRDHIEAWEIVDGSCVTASGIVLPDVWEDIYPSSQTGMWYEAAYGELGVQ
jgi:hypothetical protein